MHSPLFFVLPFSGSYKYINRQGLGNIIVLTSNCKFVKLLLKYNVGLNIVVFIFFKEFPPSDEELEAYRNGEVSQKSF